MRTIFPYMGPLHMKTFGLTTQEPPESLVFSYLPPLHAISGLREVDSEGKLNV